MCQSLASTLHSSGRLKDEFEIEFGQKSIPTNSATPWNSLLLQVKAVIGLDPDKLRSVLEKCGKVELEISDDQRDILKQLIVVLDPFLDATIVTQGENGCVISLLGF